MKTFILKDKKNKQPKNVKELIFNDLLRNQTFK